MQKALELACKEELRGIGVYDKDYKQQAKEIMKNDTSL